MSAASHARLAFVVHEVRSPVAALAAVAEAAADAARDAASLDQLVRLTLTACEAIERVVTDVALASVHTERVDVAALAREAVAAHVVQGADVVCSTDAGLVVDGDAVRLRQVLDNLIVNALTHGSSRVTVSVTRGGDSIFVAVSDTGPGIDESELERVFEPGVRLQGRRPGSGLGLPLARAIAEAHGGSLHAEPGPTGGTTFTMALPLRRAQPDTAASSS